MSFIKTKHGLIIDSIKMILVTTVFIFIYSLLIQLFDKILLSFSINIKYNIVIIMMDILKINEENTSLIFYLLIVLPGIILWSKIVNKFLR